jgi:electron-transferring-flavoprotein dehydrogenase
MDPRGINELMPDWKERGAPVESRVEEDHFLLLTKNRKFALPLVPPPLQNHGNYIISLNKFTRWLGVQVGIDIFAGFSGAGLLIEDDTVVGVRTGDTGVDQNGNRRPISNPVSTFAQKSQYWLRFAGMVDEGSDPEVQLEQRQQSSGLHGRRERSMGGAERNPHRRPCHSHHRWPLRSEEFGGGFINHMAGGGFSIGFLIGLDYLDPRLDPHERFQEFKTHPYIRIILEGSTLHS